MVEELPDIVPEWEELYDRAPMDSGDPDSGGVLFHRCHPGVDGRDYFAFAEHRHVDIVVNMYYTDDNGEKQWDTYTAGPWSKIIESYQLRLGSHEDCPICNDEADPISIVQEVIDRAKETEDVAFSWVSGRDGFVGFSNDDPGSWCKSVRYHPYADITYVENDDDTLVVTVRSRYPRLYPGSWL